MNLRRINIITLWVLLLSSLTGCVQTSHTNDFLLFFADSLNEEYGYLNVRGDTIIPPGKYDLCFTDTFRTYAIVLKLDYGYVAIDRLENILYQVFPFDNGPDYVSDGLFRIIVNSKIGYADSATGKVIIKPQFDCARPFINGVAEVSNECTEQPDGEHFTWLSDKWYYIDKSGKTVKKPLPK